MRLVGDYDDTRDVVDGEVEITGSLGAMLLTWEYATVVAGRLLGINPFDQPDVESAKIATRALLDDTPEPTKPAFAAGDVEVRGTDAVVAGATTLEGAIDALLAQVGAGRLPGGAGLRRPRRAPRAR